jgi:hypothetical protein
MVGAAAQTRGGVGDARSAFAYPHPFRTPSLLTRAPCAPPPSTPPPRFPQSSDLRFDLSLTTVAAPSPSASPAVLVEEVAVPRRSTWSYTEAVAPASWNSLTFDAGRWLSGPGPLGFGVGDDHQVTKLSGTLENGIVAYFRTTFTVAFVQRALGMRADIMRDDGAVCFLNGVELLRSGINAGAVLGPTTLASSGVAGTAERTYVRLDSLPLTALRAGVNVLACEVHQVGHAPCTPARAGCCCGRRGEVLVPTP